MGQLSHEVNGKSNFSEVPGESKLRLSFSQAFVLFLEGAFKNFEKWERQLVIRPIWQAAFTFRRF